MPDINMQYFEELQRNQHSIDIEINASQIASPQQDFPMILETPNSSNSVLNVVAINELGEQLPTEIEGIANDKNWIHLKDSVQNIINHKMKVFYGGSIGKLAADSVYGSEAVWSSNHKYVSHMNDDPSGILYDSTSNNYDGTSNGGMTSNDLVDTNYGKGIEFDGNDEIETSGCYNIGTGDFVTLVKFKFTAGIDPADQWMVFTNREPASHYQTTIELNDAEYARVNQYGGTDTKISDDVALNDGNEHIVSARRVGTSFKLYVDGVEEASTTVTAENINTAVQYTLGSTGDGTAWGWFIGTIIEARFVSGTQSIGFVTTTHKNLNNPTAIGVAPFYKSISREHNFAESLQSLGRAG